MEGVALGQQPSPARTRCMSDGLRGGLTSHGRYKPRCSEPQRSRERGYGFAERRRSRSVEGVAVGRRGGASRAKVASASRRPERVSHQPTSTRRVTSLARSGDTERLLATSVCVNGAETRVPSTWVPETTVEHRARSTRAVLAYSRTPVSLARGMHGRAARSGEER